MYTRSCKPLLSNSFFVFGGRGTGKTTLLKALLPPGANILWVNLLDSVLYQKLVARPQLFFEMIPSHFGENSWVVADEIQRIPELLNAVHRLIEDRKIKFALTGSSARKLKRGSANLLAGRAFLNSLFPLSVEELGSDFNLDFILNWGSLPQVFSYSDDISRSEYLNAYVASYLKEEIKEEQVVRQLDPFVRFLETAGQSNGQIINAAKIARDAGTDTKSVLRYFQILEDTLVGFFLEPFHTSVRKVQTAKSKFYLFDLGVKKSLERTLQSPHIPGTYAYGKAFEHFFIMECKKRQSYQRRSDRFYYLRTKDNVEIDLLIERSRSELIAVEIKSSEKVDGTDLRSAISLSKDLKVKRFIVASREPAARRVDGIEILPWRQALEELYPTQGAAQVRGADE